MPLRARTRTIAVMQDLSERRHAPRAGAAIPIEDLDGGAPLSAQDISLGGMLVTTSAPRWPGTLLHVRFQVPTEPRAIRATCRVVDLAESEEGVGLSLRFLKLAPAAQLAIHRFVDQRPSPEHDEASMLDQVRGWVGRIIEDVAELRALSRPW